MKTQLATLLSILTLTTTLTSEAQTAITAATGLIGWTDANPAGIANGYDVALMAGNVALSNQVNYAALVHVPGANSAPGPLAIPFQLLQVQSGLAMGNYTCFVRCTSSNTPPSDWSSPALSLTYTNKLPATLTNTPPVAGTTNVFLLPPTNVIVLRQ